MIASPDSEHAPARDGHVLHVDVAIVGAGFAGLGMAIALKREGGRSFVVLERAGDVGGTWRDNQYPGCACDIPARLYSFSYDLETTWTRLYPQQPEIFAYLRRCVGEYGLRPHIRFNSDVIEARWNEPGAQWTVRARDGRTVHARALVYGTGPLSQPALPDVPGLDRFTGPVFHSSQWRHDLDLTGKRVAVIGTGASAIQFVPQIQPQVASLVLFQRTAPWVIPKPDAPVGRRLRTLLRVPGYAWLARKAVYWQHEVRALGFIGPRAVLEPLRRAALAGLAAQVPDPTLRAKLTPTFVMGCKRVLISNDYYPALTQPNVIVETSAIAAVEPNAIVTASGTRHEVDVVVLGTGFKATTWIAPVKIYGREGVEISDAWNGAVSTYLGISVAGFPNLFMLLGPNTTLGHNSVVLMIEAQIKYVMSALRYMRRAHVDAIDVRPTVQRRFDRKIQGEMKQTVWLSGCRSWYLDDNGRNTTLWPGFTFDYFRRVRAIVPRRYERLFSQR